MSVTSTGLSKSGRNLPMRGVCERYGGVSDRTVDRWIISGIIPPPCMRINNMRYWDEAQLEAADRARMSAPAKTRKPPPVRKTKNNQPHAA
jgi:hypothetical protein